MNHPPRLAEWCFSKLFTEYPDYSVLGDLTEEFEHHAETRGLTFAHIWYWFQLFRCLPSWTDNSVYWGSKMFVENTRLAIRNLVRHKWFSLINILGISVGLSCSMIIILYVVNELSYDTYHPGYERIYRIGQHRSIPLGDFWWAETNGPVAGAIRENYPQVESVAHAFPYFQTWVRRENTCAYENHLWFTDSYLFDVFHIPFLSGDPDRALVSDHSMVLAESIAKKYFGDENPIGQTLEVHISWNRNEDRDEVYTVTGVVEDSPENTHFKYDIFLSSDALNPWLLDEWHAGNFYTYVKLAEGVDPVAFEEQISHIAYEYVGEELTRWGQNRTLFLQPLTDIHLKSDLQKDFQEGGSIVYLYVYSIIALLILLIGCLNFVNLTIVRSTTRTREVGLRKVIGAQRIQICLQFTGETILVLFLALAVAGILIVFLLPLFNEMAGTSLTVSQLNNPVILYSLGALIVLITILTSLYPVFILSSSKAVTALKGYIRQDFRGSFLLRLLVLGQFTASLLLILCAVVVFQQLHFMQESNLGFDSSRKLVITFRGQNNYLRDNYEMIKSEFAAIPGVESASWSSTVPGVRPMSFGISVPGEGHPFPEPGWSNPVLYDFLSIDYNYLETYGIPVIAGRSFEMEAENDEQNSFLINLSAMHRLGFETPSDAIGQVMRESYYGRTKCIIGVVDDFHYRGMQHSIEPMYLEYSRSRFRVLTLTIPSHDVNRILDDVESTWNALFPGSPHHHIFVDELLGREYSYEARAGRMLGILASAALVISCLGLFGLASFFAERKHHEIGVRKVLGANLFSIISLLSRQFAVLVLISGITASPIAWYTMRLWLENFAYRIELNPVVFVTGSLVVFVIALFTVVVRSLRAAATNPVEILRNE